MELDELPKFIADVAGLPYAALLVTEDEEQLVCAHTRLEQSGMTHSEDWSSALGHLNANRRTFVRLQPPLPRELYDLIAQYEARAGAIQIFDKKSMSYFFAEFVPGKAGLLLTATHDELREIENHAPLRNKVGVIGEVAYECNSNCS